ncbi:aromatic ring-hydroxylating dioxygenase subunit alpha [Nodularia sphaerocarpa]|uniref:aromatic ring-hydroxylating dioxygenase subunit alpha n=1 Tax=Nodularia sphaerocarpa TaxID=137816 RepID=UPI001EFAE45E|nr:aromatic ring-hydroxylating dioxygenase subunit alpha [Nodularia sphaerocarpa]MDB9374914.1 aromatic ring-hydroxylating dioxygenase subunit alpha [Nodularia sphaerocarpa CS-585]MDB9380162.1 aromatic ring-hydroxylating dioxygenase subunit alpha [Nodularia sphaerocarpa CS-585A2]ULP72735.1 Toluene-4-sulfonate monooxygenase system iron-sulfur subunit TsaM1 [Nodularia sphaerocarpa UHCC 0038]
MLKNFWYACEFSSAVTNKPKQVLMFNQRFVLYRNSQGQIVALNDQCSHRGAALSLGWIEKDCLRCPYHGWKFQADGECIEIPSNAPGISIPKKARVAHYPVQEKYGFIWLFYGDLPEAERPPLPTFPEYMVSTMRPVYDDSIDNANYARLMEANLDFTHVIAVHKKSFGQRIPIDTTIKYQVDKYDWGAVAKVNYESLGNSKSFLNFLLGGRPELKTKLTLYLPNVTLAEISVGRGNRFDIKFGILVAHLPIDENRTRVKRVLYRNILPLPWLDGFFRKIDHKLAQEDTVVVSTLNSQAMPQISEELHVAADALDITFRQFLQKSQAEFSASSQDETKRTVDVK